MERHQVELGAPGFGRAGTVIRYGHWGRPVLVFPSERGRAWDYESNGMVGAVAELIDGGRCKLYCVDSFDEQTWSDSSIPLEERARRHGAYASWIIDHVVPWIGQDSPGSSDAVAALGLVERGDPGAEEGEVVRGGEAGDAEPGDQDTDAGPVGGAAEGVVVRHG